MAIAQLAALTGLLGRLSRSPSAEPPRDVEETLGRACGPWFHDRYAPRAPARATAIAIHGVTVHGARDRRLVHFARSLAQSRVRCYVPTLPGLASCRWTTDDLDALAALVRLARAEGCGRPMLLGFSNGASYALVAAARPEVAADVRFVLAFGGYHSLAELLDELAANEAREPTGTATVDDYLYAHIVLGRYVGEAAGLSEPVRRQIDDMLDRYCFEASDEDKRALYQQHLRGRGLAKLARELTDPGLLAALSPAGQLDRLRCPVSLVHDARDTFVLPVHAERMHAELRAAPGGDRHRLLVTSLLSHVSLADSFRWGELGRLARVLAPVLKADHE
jgi:pimeloyl-ACP methyl ester carboxylesterase